MAELKFPADNVVDEVLISHQISIAIAATTLVNLGKARRKMRIDRVEFVFDTTITAHASNYYELDVRHGSTPAAKWSFDSDVAGQGTVVGDVVTAMVNEVDASLVVPAGAVLKFGATKAASAGNLPATGRVNIFGRYI
jgi:hypothetical protein